MISWYNILSTYNSGPEFINTNGPYARVSLEWSFQRTGSEGKFVMHSLFSGLQITSMY